MGCGRVLCSTVVICAVVGCGPSNIGTVSGTVTLDGQPLPDALVTFTPIEDGSPSSGRTDANGSYTLRYTRSIVGAEPGEHVVSVSTYTEGDPDAEPPIPEVAEKVPAKYNEKSELKQTVTKGSNTIDLALEGGDDDD